jgi:tryptophan synthase alpha chain
VGFAPFNPPYAEHPTVFFMNSIDALFTRLRTERKKAFIPFLTAGDPNLETSAALIEEAARRGASLIEIGFPYSDPIADGSVIQASYTRALEKGVKIDGIFDMIRGLSAKEPFRSGQTPLAGMVSYSLVFHRGPEAFLKHAKEAGLAGLIVPDLPLEESVPLSEIARKLDFKLIQLVTPTTPRDRAEKIAATSTGFLYCVSVVGITGARVELPPELLDQLHWLRTKTTLPLCVGFGISKPEHVHMLKPAADGVIVGSHLVRRLENPNKLATADLVRQIGDEIQSLATALNG